MLMYNEPEVLVAARVKPFKALYENAMHFYGQVSFGKLGGCLCSNSSWFKTRDFEKYQTPTPVFHVSSVHDLHVLT